MTLSLGAELSGEQLIAAHDLQCRRVRTLSRGWQADSSRQLLGDRDGRQRKANGTCHRLLPPSIKVAR